jgi:hypothetical protein
MLKQLWDEVSEQTIKNCFVKSSFKLESNVENLDLLEFNFDIEFWDELTQQLDIEGADFLEFVNVNNQMACGLFTNSQFTDTQFTDTQFTDTQSTDTQSTDTQSTDTQSTDTQSTDTPVHRHPLHRQPVW